MGITRREFIDGVACAVAAGVVHSPARADEDARPYPPALTGSRGSRNEDLKVAHSVRDGVTYSIEDHPVAETVDCVVVGSGISGLSAAFFLRQLAPKLRILILDNHDDFGGHARRNEFQVDGRLLLGYGGSESIQAPQSSWTASSRRLLRDLGVNLARFNQAFDARLYADLGMSFGCLFRREVFGTDRLVTGDRPPLPWEFPEGLQHTRSVERFAADCPLSEAQRNSLIALYTQRRELYPGASETQIRERLARISYADFLTNCWGIDPVVLRMFLGRTLDMFALTADRVPADNAADSNYPGFQGLKLRSSGDYTEPYIYHFPDGNASIARLLVRRLIPEVAPGHSMDDIVTARFDYTRLDRARSPVRLRLSSTVVGIQNRGPQVDVLYVGGDGPRRIRSRHVIYAGYEMMLPHICSDLPPEQRAAMASNIKMPLVYVNVALSNWRAWAERGVHTVANPTGFYSVIKLDYPVSLGEYRFARSADEPIVVHMVHVPHPELAGVDCRTYLRAARAELYARPFADFEAAARDELGRTLAGTGFDHQRDIAAITVNRWGHGYAFDSNALSDPDAPRGLAKTSRRPVGRISIAGSDAGWEAIAHAAIDEARRAASEVLERSA